MRMGSSREGNCKGIDTSVGGLVWVRRRNGSWWPGRIMGVDELPETFLVSQRLGTPVKLLGREDASVDWYNLEKSKRVKAFRCGDYDECIEKAKASAAHSNKKAVKYARREDAILHALELENAYKSNHHWEFSSRMDSTSRTRNGTLVRKYQNMFGPVKEDEFIEENHSLPEDNVKHDLSQSVVSCEGLNSICTSEIDMQRNRRKNPNDSEDDGTEGTKRMRGLQDLGLRVESRRKPDIQIKTERSQENVSPDSTSPSESNICNSLSSNSPVNSSKGSCSSLKRRSCQVAHDNESFKKKNRHRPLTKVLETTAKVAVPPFCDRVVSTGQLSLQEVTENKESALESTESKKEEFSVVLNNNSDCTGTSCEKENSLNASEHTGDAAVDATLSHCLSKTKDYAFSQVMDPLDNGFSNNLVDTPFFSEENQIEVFVASGSRKLRSFGRQSSHSCQTRSVLLNNDEVDENGSTCFAVEVNYVPYSLDKGTSKWQLKGKRNSRCLSKSASKGLGSSTSFVDDINPSNHYLMGKQDKDASFVGYGCKLEKNSSGGSLISDNSDQLVECRNFSGDLGDGSLQWNNPSSDAQAHTAGLSDSGFIKSGRRDLGIREASIQSMNGKSGLRNSSYKNFVTRKSTTRSLNKESSLLRGPADCCVPRQMAVSHLSSYSRDKIMDSSNRNVYEGSFLFDVNLDVRASYQGQRVPLVSLMSKLNGKAIIGHPVTVEVLKDGYCELLMSSIEHSPSKREQLMDLAYDPPLPGRNVNISGTMQCETGYAVDSLSKAQKKTSRHSAGHPPLSRKKLAKMRKCGFLSKKTRKLSSFAVDHNYKEERNKSVVVKSEGRVISCVPLKLVLSRIDEALNCSPGPAHHM